MKMQLLSSALEITFIPAAWGSLASFLSFTAKYIVQAKVERIKFLRAGIVAPA